MGELLRIVTAFQTFCSNRRLVVHRRVQRFAGGLAGALIAELCRSTVMEGAQDWLTVLSWGAGEIARKVAPEVTTE